MNTKGNMSYKDFIFPVNPYVINITHKKQVAEQKVPYAFSKVYDFGQRCRIISGEGEFCGTQSQSDFLKLKSVFESGGGGMLYIPSQKPVYAVFESLELIGKDIDGVIQYRFRFTESFDKIRSDIQKVCIADGKLSLWDYSYMYDLRIEELLSINPDVPRPDTVIQAGKKVHLC